MAVQARFYVAEIHRFAGQEGAQVVMRPSLKKSEDNVAWSKYTPTGEFKMMVSLPEVAEWFDEQRKSGATLSIVIDEIPTSE